MSASVSATQEDLLSPGDWPAGAHGARSPFLGKPPAARRRPPDAPASEPCSTATAETKPQPFSNVWFGASFSSLMNRNGEELLMPKTKCPRPFRGDFTRPLPRKGRAFVRNVGGLVEGNKRERDRESQKPHVERGAGSHRTAHEGRWSLWVATAGTTTGEAFVTRAVSPRAQRSGELRPVTCLPGLSRGPKAASQSAGTAPAGSRTSPCSRRQDPPQAKPASSLFRKSPWRRPASRGQRS